MEILLVRYGRSEADSLNVHEGRADFELTEKGRRQVTALAAWLKENERFDVVYASPLKRAAETAETVAKASPLKRPPSVIQYQKGAESRITPVLRPSR